MADIDVIVASPEEILVSAEVAEEINVTVGGGSSAANLTNLGDVTIDTPLDEQHLVYNATTEQWENTTSSGGGVSDWGDINGTLSDQADLQLELDALVPYTGADSDVDLGTNSISVGGVDFTVGAYGDEFTIIPTIGFHNVAGDLTFDGAGPGYQFIFNKGAVFNDGLSAGNNKITGVLDPTADQDAATKKYVDDNGGGDISGLVPYTGATTNLDLGTHSLEQTYGGIYSDINVDAEEAVIINTTQSADVLLKADGFLNIRDASGNIPFWVENNTGQAGAWKGFWVGENDEFGIDNQGNLSTTGTVSGSNLSGTNTGDQVSADGSIDTHSDVDITSEAPSKNDHLIFNGTNFVPAPEGTTFTFSCTSFSDGESTTQLIGSGVWQADETMSYTASYDNGPPTSADVLMSNNGAAYTKVGEMTASAYTTGTNTDGDINYPTAKDRYLRFRLDSSDGTDNDTDYDSSIYFRNYVRWGTDTINSGFTEADVEGLSGSSITNSYTSSRSINAGSGEYLVVAYPSSYTSIHANGFRFNSVTCPFESAETVSITNSAGYTEDYKVFASTNANLGNSTLSMSTSSNLINPLYYGVTTKTDTYLESDVEGLATSTITNDNTQAWNAVTTGSGEYMLFAFPTRLGIPSFWVGGFEGGFESPETVSVTNVNGYSENYYVWRSSNSNLGSSNVVTQ